MIVVNWTIAHWGDILAIYAGVVTVASIIVKLTPTLKDDTILLTIVKFVAKYIALNTNSPAGKDRPE